jgi:hypothetical protein
MAGKGGEGGVGGGGCPFDSPPTTKKTVAPQREKSSEADP